MASKKGGLLQIAQQIKKVAKKLNSQKLATTKVVPSSGRSGPPVQAQSSKSTAQSAPSAPVSLGAAAQTWDQQPVKSVIEDTDVCLLIDNVDGTSKQFDFSSILRTPLANLTVTNTVLAKHLRNTITELGTVGHVPLDFDGSNYVYADFISSNPGTVLAQTNAAKGKEITLIMVNDTGVQKELGILQTWRTFGDTSTGTDGLYNTWDVDNGKTVIIKIKCDGTVDGAILAEVLIKH